ncbi:hypothetical protein PIB30_027209 [Stylosanthes scabra]|uniref:Pectinesterase inhibitor domain-containing protein n=1 Tax=Stylosanthes scabra TaxID=79078 RepID=A0ABU6TAA0_9FABA|nr:hypothetical protein [Stylosanthes scabra]
MEHFSLNILLCTIVLASISIEPCHSNDRLIRETCSKTPNPSLCVSYIKADPKSNNVNDVPGLGIIMAQIFQLKGRDARDILFLILSTGRRPDIQAQLKACLGSYDIVINSDMPVAINGFKVGKPRWAEAMANSAVIRVSDCERSFNGKSPITPENNITREIAVLLLAIARQL